MVALVCVTAIVVSGATAAYSTPAPQRVGGRPFVPADARADGPVAPGTKLGIGVVLRVRNPAALKAFAAAVTTPGNANYRHYLTVRQFADRFGATVAELRAVRASLRAQGLHPGVTTANHLFVTATGTAAVVERAFAVKLRRYKLPASGALRSRTGYAPNQAPQLKASIAGDVQQVLGLDTLVQEQPLGLVRPKTKRSEARRAVERPDVVPGAPAPCSEASAWTTEYSSPRPYTDDQLAQAYGFDGMYSHSDLGAGQTIAIYELEPNLTSDISAFESCYGINTTVNYEEVNNGDGTSGAGTGAGVGEAALDIETIAALAPDATLDVYQSENGGYGPIYNWDAILGNSAVHVVSVSWGLCEALTGSGYAGYENQYIFYEAASQGVAILDAAGDTGSEGCERGNNSTSLGVSDAASQPYVTGVGGTSLNGVGSPPSETVWNESALSGGAGGGGISSLWDMPSYQTGAPTSLNVVNPLSSGTPCGNSSGYCREVPDVSADADPYTGYVIYYNGNGSASDTDAWEPIGGTSAAAPLWAAYIALTNASSMCRAKSASVGFANPGLYAAAGADYSDNFNDITVGNNDYQDENNGMYPAGTGYDMASGLGTPIGNNLASSLCGDPINITSPGTLSYAKGFTITPLQLTASAGTGLSYSASGLPTGLSLSSAGVLSGEPTSSGTFTATVTATDADNATGTLSLPLTVTSQPVVTVTAPASQSWPQDSPISNLTVQATDSSGESDIFSATGLPTGVTISSSGVISGTPTVAGAGTATITAHDASGASGSATFSYNVPTVVTVTSPGAQSWTVNTAVSSLTVHASDTGGQTLTFSATGLPAGLSISSSGVISGTPTAAGSGTATVNVQDTSGSTGSTTFSYTVVPLVTVTSPGAQTWTQGSTISSLAIQASDSSSEQLTFSATGLPAGLSISSSGVITGKPTSSGTGSITVTAQDTSGGSGSATFSYTVSTTVVTVTSPGAQSWTQNSAISSLAIQGSDTGSGQTLTYSATGLPAGLSISSAGAITGTPTADGSGSIKVTATDGNGSTGSATFSYTVATVVTVTQPASQSWSQDQSIVPLTVTAHDSDSNQSLTFSSSNLPAGLSIWSSGVIAGTPTQDGSGSITVKAQDGTGSFATTTFSYTIATVITVVNPGSQSWTQNAAITPITVAGSDSDSSQTLTYGATGLPSGLSISATTGQISGTPTPDGSGSITVTATDGTGSVGSTSFFYTVNTVVGVTSPGSQSWTQDVSISPVAVTASDTDSSQQLTYGATGLPAGLTIDRTSGVISGSPTQDGSGSITVTATDGTGSAGSTTFSYTVATGIIVTSPGPQSWSQSEAITPLQIAGSDTDSSKTLTYSSSDLPAGLSVSTAGVISGTPSTDGSGSITITATDGTPSEGSVTFAYVVNTVITVTSPGSQSWTQNSSITPVTVTASDSDASQSLTFSSKDLPAGLSISTAGVISGTPSNDGTGRITITGQDGTGSTGSTTLSYTVATVVNVTQPASQSWSQGKAITPLTVAAGDSDNNQTLSYSSSDLPAGLAISSTTGTISGTPTADGSGSITVTATDGTGSFGSTTFSYTTATVVSLTSPGEQSWTQNTAIAPITVAGSDSDSSQTLTYSSTDLPAGLSISPTGVISGTPTQDGSGTITVTAQDGTGSIGSTTFDDAVATVVSVTSPGSQSWIYGVAITPVTVAYSDSDPNQTPTFTATGLPAGLSISSAGVISGTPTGNGTGSATVTAQDGTGGSGSATFSYDVATVISVTQPASQSWTQGDAITPITVDANDSDSSRSLTFNSSDLPAGLSISSAGVISGAPTQDGSGSITVTASDGTGSSGATTFSYSVATVVSLSSPGEQSWTENTAITPVAIAGSDSDSSQTLSYSSSDLPAGLSISSAGVISGTPTHDGIGSITVTAQDGTGSVGSTSFNYHVGTVVTVSQLASQSWSQDAAITPLTVTASDTDGSQTLTYSATGLPSGLSISSTSGAISGTPTANGNGVITVTATDGTGSTGSTTFFYTVATVVTVSKPASQSWTQGSAITPLTIAASDTNSSESLNYSATGLPAGLSISSLTGKISGTPTGTGSGSITVTVTDATMSSASTMFNYSVVAPVVTVTSPGTHVWTQHSTVSPITVKGSDTGPGETLSFSATGLPAGLSISSASGVISGTPTTTGVGTVTITATDKTGASGAATFAYAVVGLPTGTLTFAAPKGKSPKLTQTLKAGAETTLTSVTIALPSAISMASTKDVTVKTTGGKVLKVTESAHSLVITFSGASAATITVTSPSITISSTLASEIKKKKAETETFTTKIVDTFGPATTLTTKVKLP
jgi:subtilase family serine protease